MAERTAKQQAIHDAHMKACTANLAAHEESTLCKCLRVDNQGDVIMTMPKAPGNVGSPSQVRWTIDEARELYRGLKVLFEAQRKDGGE